MPLDALAAAATHTLPPRAAGISRISSSDALVTGGFTPGTILDGRYRVIGLLGRGGMGEVYRADDLKLGQPVALKFLPRDLAEDPVRRERFFAEVRIARQISHPNVCRVYDVADVEGQHFLSMEYVDGEDLASLLQRIGHLPSAKAMEIARQLCAGLAAAHDKGVLHRDLKPANIMLDGRGRVRITDFGLAVAADEVREEGGVSGTPAYMAPEQLAGGPASVRSDIYALGLVLYELHTGRRAFDAPTLAELRRQKESGTASALSEFTRDVDPLVERVIQRCIETDPRLRPVSALQVAAALPGGDPLAAALAAGETPSPEMVAASGSAEGLRPSAAWMWLGATIVLSALALAAAERTVLSRRGTLHRAPASMADDARDLLRAIGYTDPPGDSAHGVLAHYAYYDYVLDHLPPAERWERSIASGTVFWYRQSPSPFARIGYIREFLHASVGPNDPPFLVPGSVRATFDAAGRLLEFAAVPPSLLTPAEPSVPDWAPLFAAAGLRPDDWTPVAPTWTPLFHADVMRAWAPRTPDGPGDPVGVHAVALGGRPTHFVVAYPWTPPPRMPALKSRGGRIADLVLLSLFLLLLVSSVAFARRNIRVGRADWKGAIRLAAVAAVLMTVTWLLDEVHVADLWEVFLFLMFVGFTLFISGLLATMYLAFEPYVRRHWPSVLVSWSRLLAGGVRDPLVGRDLLIGCAAGALLEVLRHYALLAPGWLGFLPENQLLPWQRAFAGTPQFVAMVCYYALVALFLPLGLIFLVFFTRVLVRHVVLAGLVVAALLSAANAAVAVHPLYLFSTGILLNGLIVFVVMRVGLLAGISLVLTSMLLWQTPSMFPLSAWHSGLGIASVAIVGAIATFGFRTSLAGRPAFGDLSID